MAKNNSKQNTLKELKRIEEDTLYSAKGHFCAAQEWELWHLRLGMPATVLAAVAGISALSSYETIAGIVAFLVTVITAVMTFLNPSERASKHQNAGNAYNALRNEARILHNVKGSSLDLKVLQEKMDKLNKEKNRLNESAPQIPRWAFEKARKGIEEGEAEYKVDQDLS